jgi:hypothetical protein
MGRSPGPAGTTRWAREIFAQELDRLGVACDRRRALDDRLDEIAEWMSVSRTQVIRAYLTADSVRSIAQQVAMAVTGRDISLLEAAVVVAEAHPEAAEWPQAVRNYLIDHVSAGGAAGSYVEAFGARRVSVEDLGLFRFRYRDSSDLVGELGYGAGGAVPVVSIQHPDLVARRGPLRADPDWGRPHFEWAYKFVHACYGAQSGGPCPRLLWAWADLPTCVAAHRPDLVAPGALAQLAPVAAPGSVAVAAMVPIERCVFTSHVLFDGLMLRGRYIPNDIDDAIDMHRRFGRCALPNDAAPDPALYQAISDSWVHRLFLAPHDWRDVRLQVCVDRIERDEIVSVAPLRGGMLEGGGMLGPVLGEMFEATPEPPPGIEPERLDRRGHANSL